MKNSLLHLSLLPGIGPGVINRVIETVGRESLSTIYDFCVSDFIQTCELSPAQASKLVVGLSDRMFLERELLLAQKNSVRIVTIFDSDYPDILRQIYLPPVVLYIQGAVNGTKALAVVGSRKANSYAKSAVELIVPSLIENGWAIVSGGAFGADTFAHQTALAAGGATYVVLGSGLLRRYPVENNRLFDAIRSSGGALISSFALEHPPLPGNFPARNRIIAGLGKGCLVVQAAEKSGASITARFALEQGKEVFVVPGRIDDPLHQGGHRLIQQGAKLITNAQDILEEFDESIAGRTASVQSLNTVAHCEKKVGPASHEDPILFLCAQSISAEELMLKADISFSELNQRLFDLQIDGKIEQDHAGLWHCV